MSAPTLRNSVSALGEAAHADDKNIGEHRFQKSAALDAAHPGHFRIRDDDVINVVSYTVYGVDPIICLIHFVARELHRARQDFHDFRGVVYNQYPHMNLLGPVRSHRVYASG